MITRIAVLGLAGAAGTIGRYAFGALGHHLFGTAFPYGTLIVNVLGCLAIGLLGTLADDHQLLTPPVRLTLVIGFLGAFTTFSSFAYDTWALLKAGNAMFAALNVAASFIACFVGLFMGIMLARGLARVLA